MIWQSSYRAYRLNQKLECRTYYLAYEDTIQEMVIRLIAEKKVATSAIQGKFSSEGLAAMASGVDMKMKLAQALSEKDFKHTNKIQQMFDVLSESRDDNTFDNYSPMVLLKELLSEDNLIDLENQFSDIPDMNNLLDELIECMSADYEGSSIQEDTFCKSIEKQFVKHEKNISISVMSDIFSLF